MIFDKIKQQPYYITIFNIMTSPFTCFNNVVLKIPSESNQQVVDPESGNVTLGQTFTNYDAIFLIKKTGLNIYTDGVNRREVEIRGYLVKPMFFPISFTLPQAVEFEFTDIQNRKTKGIVELNTTLDTFKVGHITGQAIQGTIRIDGKSNANKY
jgi:hypothetical protein